RIAVSRRAASSAGSDVRASLRNSAPPAVRGLRPLRLLPARVPDVGLVGRGDGLASRTHRPDARPRGGPDRLVRAGGEALRPLPRLPRVRDRVSLGRPLRRPHRADAPRTRAPPSARRPRWALSGGALRVPAVSPEASVARGGRETL